MTPGRSKPRPSIAALLTLVLVGCGGTDRPTPAADRAAIENGLRRAVIFEGEDSTFSLEERMRHYGVPGLSLAVLEDGEVAWTGAYGTKTREEPQPVDHSTLFQAASISKPVTAVAVLRMRDAGLVDLDADVKRYLDGFELPRDDRTGSKPVTLRNLLSHTAGLTPGGYHGYARGEPRPTDREIVAGIPPANTPPVRIVMSPGERVAYSGGGYTLIELALQDVTGRPFADLMEDWVLSKADMESSTFSQPLPEELEVSAARGHRADGGVIEGGWRVHPEEAAAGLWTTAADLARFAIELRRSYLGQGDLLERSTAREMLTEVREDEGLGLILRGQGRDRYFLHAGGNRGFRAYMILHLETGDGLVFMTNSDEGFGPGRELLRAVAAAQGWRDYRSERMRRVAVSRDSLSGLAGRYDFGDVSVEVTLPGDGDSLAASLPNGDVYDLVPTGPRSFVHPGTGTTLEFPLIDGRQRLTVFGDTGVRIPR